MNDADHTHGGESQTAKPSGNESDYAGRIGKHRAPDANTDVTTGAQPRHGNENN